MKICPDCKKEKLLNAVPKDTRYKDDRGTYCNKCSWQRQKKSKANNREHYRKYIREYMRARRGYQGGHKKVKEEKPRWNEEEYQSWLKTTLKKR